MSDDELPDRQYFRLVHDEARRRAIEAVRYAPEGYVVVVQPPTRTLDQNSMLWPLLTAVARQVVWYGRKLKNEQWKHIFTASLVKQDVVPNLEGDGFVVLGVPTRTMSKKLFSDLIELILAWGTQRDPPVNFDRGEKDGHKAESQDVQGQADGGDAGAGGKLLPEDQGNESV